VEMGIQTEAEFWSTIEGPAGSVGKGLSAGQQLPVPSTIPSMSDVVRTNTEVKVKLDAAQVCHPSLHLPGTSHAGSLPRAFVRYLNLGCACCRCTSFGWTIPC
jgi:hypothetical protein